MVCSIQLCLSASRHKGAEQTSRLPALPVQLVTKSRLWAPVQQASPQQFPGLAAQGADGLRRQWEALLNEAALCKEELRQLKLAHAIKQLLPQVHQVGISTKYGRKVLTRLEKVQAVRDELYAAKFEQPANMGRLRKALDDAAAYSTLIDASLLASIQDSTSHCLSA
eukprot:jgi/Astpho2/2653/Aster-x0113